MKNERATKRPSSNEHKVVITGMGCVSSLGITAEQTWEGIVNGKSGIKKAEIYKDLPVNVFSRAVTYEDEDLVGDLPDKVVKSLTTPMKFFFSAVREAYEHANLSSVSEDLSVGLLGGTTGNYPVELELEDLLSYYKDSKDGHVDWSRYADTYPADHFYRHLTNSMTYLTASHFNLRGTNQTIHNACASGTQTIGEAYRLLKHGYEDVVIAGGTEALGSFSGITGMYKLGVLSTAKNPEFASRPFDLERNGLVLGDGAAVLVLETEESARARNVPILAEVVGFGTSMNAYRITDAPIGGEAASLAIKQCIREANIEPTDISAVNAHATSTMQNDISEANALEQALGGYSKQVPVYALKSMLGHTLSAAGAIELMLAVYSLQEQIIPPTPSYVNKDPECDLNISAQAVKKDLKYILKNSFGFGGQNGSILLKRRND